MGTGGKLERRITKMAVLAIIWTCKLFRPESDNYWKGKLFFINLKTWSRTVMKVDVKWGLCSLLHMHNGWLISSAQLIEYFSTDLGAIALYSCNFQHYILIEFLGPLLLTKLNIIRNENLCWNSHLVALHKQGRPLYSSCFLSLLCLEEAVHAHLLNQIDSSSPDPFCLKKTKIFSFKWEKNSKQHPQNMKSTTKFITWDFSFREMIIMTCCVHEWDFLSLSF